MKGTLWRCPLCRVLRPLDVDGVGTCPAHPGLYGLAVDLYTPDGVLVEEGSS